MPNAIQWGFQVFLRLPNSLKHYFTAKCDILSEV